MMEINKDVRDIVEKLSKIDNISFILLSGSQTSGKSDKKSDYDIYIYSDDEIKVEPRSLIIKEYSDDYEIDNKIWETEDIFVLRKSGIKVELMYRRIEWINNMLDNILHKYHSSNGYSTCFWYNVKTSYILYDKSGEAEKLIKRCQVSYPEGLKMNILTLNYPLILKAKSSYYYQIESALRRDDMVSLCHRTAELIASYFDIIFAINKVPHPGEKRLVEMAKYLCASIPYKMEENINTIIKCISMGDYRILIEIQKLMENLDNFIQEHSIKI